MKIDIETLRKTKGIGSKTLERIIEQHKIDKGIKSFKSEYIPSDTYKIDQDINLWHGDCLELMNHIPDKSVDMVLCDLPYGTTACSWDEVIPFEPLWSHYKRIIKDNGVIVLFGSEPFSTKLKVSNMDWFRESLVWLKNKSGSGILAQKRHLKVHEDIMVFANNGDYLYNPIKWHVGDPDFLTKRKTFSDYGDTNNIYGNFTRKRKADDGLRFPISILSYPVPITPKKGCSYAEDVDVNIYPTQKPIKLLEYLIKTYTNEGMTVLDNTMGSGSTGVACKNLNRRFIGIELGEKGFNIAKKRINEN